MDAPNVDASKGTLFRSLAWTESGLTKTLVLFGIDILSLCTASIFSGRLVNGDAGVHNPILMTTLALASLSLFAALGLYRLKQRPPLPTQALRAAIALVAVALCVIGASVLMGATKNLLPVVIGIWAIIAISGSTLTRLARYVSLGCPANSHETCHAYLIGSRAEVERALALQTENTDCATHIRGVFLTDRSRTVSHIGTGPVLGGLSDVGTYVHENSVHTLLIATRPGDTSTQESIMSHLAGLDIDGYLIVPDVPSDIFIDGSPRFGVARLLQVQKRPMGEFQRAIKRIFDVIMAGIMTLLMSPVMLAAAIAIKCESRGPIIFAQPRYGYNDQLVTIYKFRTMYYESEDIKAKRSTKPNDPRVTRVGRILRRTSMDELPQLINVLQGRMAIVGPRPHAPGSRAGEWNFRDAMPHYRCRHRVRPGITGAAQISGWRGPTETLDKLERRVEHDIWYIHNWSPALDLKILLKTPLALFGANTF